MERTEQEKIQKHADSVGDCTAKINELVDAGVTSDFHFKMTPKVLQANIDSLNSLLDNPDVVSLCDEPSARAAITKALNFLSSLE